MLRYNTDGSLDPSFDGDGKVLTDIGGHDRASDLALQPDGKIVAAGEGALARYNGDGTLDTSFGGDGIVMTMGYPGHGVASLVAAGVAIQSNGKIIVAGSGPSGYTGVARYEADGSLDSAFGDGGLVTTADVSANDVALQADGRIVVAGSRGLSPATWAMRSAPAAP